MTLCNIHGLFDLQTLESNSLHTTDILLDLMVALLQIDQMNELILNSISIIFK